MVHTVVESRYHAENRLHAIKNSVQSFSKNDLTILIKFCKNVPLQKYKRKYIGHHILKLSDSEAFDLKKGGEMNRGKKEILGLEGQIFLKCEDGCWSSGFPPIY